MKINIPHYGRDGRDGRGVYCPGMEPFKHLQREVCTKGIFEFESEGKSNDMRRELFSSRFRMFSAIKEMCIS